jgi:hypothetical protein
MSLKQSDSGCAKTGVNDLVTEQLKLVNIPTL